MNCKLNEYILLFTLDKMSQPQPHTKPTEEKLTKDQMNFLVVILENPKRMIRAYENFVSKGIDNLEPNEIFLRTIILDICPNILKYMKSISIDMSRISERELLLKIILGNKDLISEFEILASADESLLTPEGILLRNTFLKICQNIPNLV